VGRFNGGLPLLLMDTLLICVGIAIPFALVYAVAKLM
jgi:hypothetical protein